ncbi:MAG: hypothetical protein MJ252_17930 [archaeon]|nr:hypothetical protein [archaeon]
MEETNLSQEGLSVNTPMLQQERNPYLDVEGQEPPPQNMMMQQPNMQMQMPPTQANPYLQYDPDEDPSAQGIVAPALPGEPMDDLEPGDGQDRSRISMYNKASNAPGSQGMKMHESSDLSPDVE